MKLNLERVSESMLVLGLGLASMLWAISAMASEPCIPNAGDAHPYCKEYPGSSQASYQMVKVPQVSFYSKSGTQKAWLAASGGTWRVRLMHFSVLNESDGGRNHFHQVAHSDLAMSGAKQEVSHQGVEGQYRYEVECENDCVGKEFKLLVLVP